MYKDTRNLMPDGIEGLKETYECITAVLNDVTRTKESNEDRNAKVKSVIMADIEQLVNLIVARKTLMRHGERVCIIEEINNLIRQIDHARENNVDINSSNKERLGLHKSELLEDQRKEELENRKIESLGKARINNLLNQLLRLVLNN